MAHAPRPLWLLLPLCLALAWFWPVLGHGLRSDDLLTAYYVEPSTGAVQWGRVAEEFVRPWFGVRDLYRPLISLSFAVDAALVPPPLGRHLANVLMVGVTAAATAAVAARLAPRRPRLAGLAAAALVVLHPAAVESAAWVAARVTTLQTCCASLAWWAYARHLDGRTGRRGYLLAMALALASKEGAVMLPLSLLGLDCWLAPAAPLAARVRRLWPAAVLLLGYFGWRKLLLGVFTTAGGGHALADRAQHLLVRGQQLGLPPGPAGEVGAPWAIGLAVALLVLWGLAVAAARPRASAVLAPLWAWLLLLPTSHLPASLPLLDGRFLFDAVPVLALLVAVALGAAARRGAVAAAAATLVALGCAGLGAQQWLGRYEAEDQEGRAVAAAVRAEAATAAPGRPFGCSGLPGLPLFHGKLWGTLALPPWADRRYAVVGLPELLTADDQAPASFADAAPVHALLAAGGRVASWQREARRFAALQPAAAPVVGLARGSGTAFLAPAPLPAAACGALRVRLPGPVAQLELRLLDDLPGALAVGPVAAALAAPASEVWFDLSHLLPPVVFESLGVPFRGVALAVGGAPLPAGAEVELHRDLAGAPLAAPDRAAPGPWPREAWFAALQPPRPDLPLRLYVLLPTGVRVADAVPGAPFVAPAEIRDHLGFCADIFGPSLVHWFWQTPRGWSGRPWRSGLAFAEVR